MIAALSLRRARRDLVVLTVWIALVAFAVLLAIGGPHLQRTTVDAGARQAVASAGSATDILVGAHVGRETDGVETPVKASDIVSLAASIPARLPASVRAVYAGDALAVTGPVTGLANATPHLSLTRPVNVQVDLLTAQDSKAIDYSAGAPPSTPASSTAVNVIISTATARATGLGVGSILRVSTIPVASGGTGSAIITLRVSGIVTQRPGASGDASPWRDLATVWKPTIPTDSGGSEPIQIAALANIGGVEEAAARYSDTFTATLRVRMRPAAFTDALESQVGTSLAALAANSARLAGTSHAQLSVSSEYVPALAAYPALAGAATAQISIMAAGVVGAAAALILLVSSLLVARRAADTALERARGASLASIGLRSLAESVALALAGVAIGFAAALASGQFPIDQPVLVAIVIAVAVLATPVQAVLAARPTWAGRRVPANRADRVEIERGLRVRRIALELTLTALAVTALVALLGRGLLESHTDGVDPLLASAPLAIAIVVTIVALRVYRWPLRLGVTIGRRSTGALGLLAAIRAQASIAVLPLLALTISIALAVSAGLIAGTVSAGQDAASWQRVGADARVDTPVSPAAEARAVAAPGVTGSTAYNATDGVQLRLGTGTDFATVVAVDPGFAAFETRSPESGFDAADAASLDRLARSSPASSPVPVVVDAGIAQEVSGAGVGMYYGRFFVRFHVVGTVSDAQAGYLAAPFIYVDRAALARRIGHPVTANAVLIDGPGAVAAARAVTARAPAIHTRRAWLARLRARAEVSGVATSISLAMLCAAILAALALPVVAVLGRARERGRSLALVRTLGLSAAAGPWLALAELAPVVVASLVGGIVAGIGIVALLEPVIGLIALTGGLGDPPPTFSAAVLVWLSAGAIALLLGAVAIEFAVRRQDRLSEVLRVGETV